MVDLPTHVLVRKFERFVSLTDDDYKILSTIGGDEEFFDADVDIVAEGERPRTVFVMLEGLACRYRLLNDGARQIITFLLPGDICDLHVFLVKAMDHSIGTLTPVRLAPIRRDVVLEMTIRNPRISVALLWGTLQEEAMLRERIVSLGRRNAAGRLAYLLCELVWRHQAIGLADGHNVSLPLTQKELADTLGMSSVHVNRILQQLRREQLLTFERQRLELLNVEKLSEIAQFNDQYLHFGKAPDEIQRYLEQF